MSDNKLQYEDDQYEGKMKKIFEIGKIVQNAKHAKLVQQQSAMGMTPQTNQNQEVKINHDEIIQNVNEELQDLYAAEQAKEQQKIFDRLQEKLIREQLEMQDLEKKMRLSYIFKKSQILKLPEFQNKKAYYSKSVHLRTQMKNVYSFRSMAFQSQRNSPDQSIILPKVDNKIQKMRNQMNINSNRSSIRSIDQQLNQQQQYKLNVSLDLNEFAQKKLNMQSSDEQAERKKKIDKKKKQQIKEIQTSSKFSQLDFLESIFTKLAQNVKDNFSNIRVNRYQIKYYLSQRYSERVIDRFMNFFEIQNSYDFQAFQNLRVYIHLQDKIIQVDSLSWNYYSFFLFDINEDRIICNSDLFQAYTIHGLLSSKACIEKDVLEIFRFVKTCLNQQQQPLQIVHSLQRSPIMKNTNMNLTQLKRSLKNNFEKTKVDVKRNTVFLSNFGAMDFFVNQNMEKLTALKEIINDDKPFQYEPDSPFSLNFLHFQTIFNNSPPNIFRDIINYLGFGDQAEYALIQQQQQRKTVRNSNLYNLKKKYHQETMQK